MTHDQLNKWLSLVQMLAPIVLVNIKGGEKIAPLVPVIVSGITEAEQIKGATGADKKAHVLNLVQVGVATANATGKVHLDAAEVGDVASSGIETVLNAIHVVNGAKVIPVPVADAAGA